MNHKLSECKRLVTKTVRVIKQDGLGELVREVRLFVPHLYRKYFDKTIVGPHTLPTDVLFISGMPGGAPMRYRCENQAEQLEYAGLSTKVLFFGKIPDARIVDYHDVIFLYRVPATDTIREIVARAKKQNKLVIYDVDDLVFDQKYVEGRSEIKELTSEQQKKYYDGVQKYGEALKLCDYATTSTEAIAREIRAQGVSHVYVSRNCLSGALVKHSQTAERSAEPKNSDECIIGYMSGSATHNDDFAMITPVLVQIMEKYTHVKLAIVGPLAIPPELEEFSDRIIQKSFVDWQKLPELQVAVDINLAPLVPSLFNDAKSEIKYTEAAIVGVPTVASAREAFTFAVRDGETGFLCETESEWLAALEKLILDPAIREQIGRQAEVDVAERYSFDKLAGGLLGFLEKHRAKKICYVAPSTKVSGGVMVILHHLQKLQSKGFNAQLVLQIGKAPDIEWFGMFSVPLMSCTQFERWRSVIRDHCVATIWSSVREVNKIEAHYKHYFVQNKEDDFYPPNSEDRKSAVETYKEDLCFFTMSRWCQQWLKDDFGQVAAYIPNGIDADIFTPAGDCYEKNDESKKRILVEGNPDSDYKNTDESFEVTNALNRDEYEIWFVSYGAEPKSHYKIDRVFQSVSQEEIAKIYRSADILLKSSKLESFSYPPLEMLLCGGEVVVARNPGNAAYLTDENAFLYDAGDVKTATAMIHAVSKGECKNSLKNQKKLAEEWSWERTSDELEKYYKFKSVGNGTSKQ